MYCLPRSKSVAYSILDPITPAPQGVVLEVKDLKACVHILDKLADL